MIAKHFAETLSCGFGEIITMASLYYMSEAMMAMDFYNLTIVNHKSLAIS